MAYPTEDTLMTISEIIERNIHLMTRADIRLQNFTRSRYRLPIATWVIRKWEAPRRQADGTLSSRIRAHISQLGREETRPIVFNPEEVLLVKGLQPLRTSNKE